MRRTLAGFLFALAFAMLCLAAGGFLLQRTVLDPQVTADAAPSVLDVPAIRKELTSRIADATAGSLGRSTIEVEALVNSVAANPEGAKILAEVLHDAHAHLIGQQRAPVQIATTELVRIVRSERVGDMPPLTIPVPRVAVLDIARVVLRWAVPLAAIAAVVLFGLGLAAHPDRAGFLRSIGFGLMVLAAGVGVAGYVVPKFLVPALSDNVWARVPPVLADELRWVTLGLAAVLLIGGAALVASAGLVRQQRRWSTPISTYRYGDERRWG